MTQKPKKPIRRKPDYLVMIFTLFVILGVFLFLRSALEDPVQTLTTLEIQEAAVDQDIASFSYELVGGENYDLVLVSGSIKDSSVSKFNNIADFEGIMRIDEADAILETVEMYGGQTHIIPKSGISFWSITLFHSSYL
ncbi:MAG: hypothetical protein ACPF9F_00455 [Acholeplasmataceae bacterium]